MKWTNVAKISLSMYPLMTHQNSPYEMDKRCKNILVNLSITNSSELTLRNMVQTKGCFLGIGAQQKTYRTRRGKGTCSIMSARNLKSSTLHMKYLSLSTWLRVTKISCQEDKQKVMFTVCISDTSLNLFDKEMMNLKAK